MSATEKKCPVCKKVVVEKYRPFCSGRCADIDLGGWLAERYTVPTDEKPGDTLLPGEDEE